MKNRNGFYSALAVIGMMLLSALVLGGPAAGEGAAEPQYTLTGLVYDMDEDAPVKGAQVVIVDFETDEVVANITTDESGMYEVDLPNGTYYLYVEADGYHEEYDDALIDGAGAYLNFTLEAEALDHVAVSGYVTDRETGEPLEGVSLSFSWQWDGELDDDVDYPDEPGESEEPKDTEVVAEGGDTGTSSDVKEPDGGDGYNYYDYWNWAYSDEAGYYEVELRPGNWSVDADLDDRYYEDDYEGGYSESGGDTPSSGGTRAGAGAEYYKWKGELTVGEEEPEMWLNITLKPLPPRSATVSGHVTDNTTGDPISGIELYLEGGLYEWGYDDDRYDSEEPVAVDVQAGATRSGEGTDVEYYWDHEYVTTDDKGYYEVSLRPGDYSLAYEADLHDIKYGILEGGEAAEDDGAGATLYLPWRTTFEIAEDGTKQIDAALDPLPPKDAKVKGTVTNAVTGAPIEGMCVEVYPEYSDSYYDYYWYDDYSDYTDSSGNYLIELREGDYSLEIWGDSVYEDYYDDDEYYYEDDEYAEEAPGAPAEPDTGARGGTTPTTRYFDYDTTFSVKSGETVVIDIKLKPYPEEDATISGTVTDAGTGEALAYAEVDVYIYIDGDSYDKDVNTDEDGYYSVNVPASTVRLVFSYYDWYDDVYYDDDDYYDEEGGTLDGDPEEDREDSGATSEDSAGGTRMETEEPAEPADDVEGADGAEGTDGGDVGSGTVGVEEKEGGVDSSDSWYDDMFTYFSYVAIMEVKSGQDVTLNVALERVPERTAEVTGTVKDAQGQTVEGAYVMLLDLDHPGTMFYGSMDTDVTGEDGTYSIETYPGNFLVMADRGYFYYPDGIPPATARVQVKDGGVATADLTLGTENPDHYVMTVTFKTWGTADVELKVNYNENSVFYRMLIDQAFGNGDGTVESSELDIFSYQMGYDEGPTEGLAEVTVDGVPFVTIGGTQDMDASGAKGAIDSVDTLVLKMTAAMKLRSAISDGNDHKVGVDVSDHLPGTFTYRLIFPDGQVFQDTVEFDPLGWDDWRDSMATSEELDEGYGGQAGDDKDGNEDPLTPGDGGGAPDDGGEAFSFDVTFDDTRDYAGKTDGSGEDGMLGMGTVAGVDTFILLVVVILIAGVLVGAGAMSARKRAKAGKEEESAKEEERTAEEEEEKKKE